MSLFVLAQDDEFREFLRFGEIQVGSKLKASETGTGGLFVPSPKPELFPHLVRLPEAPEGASTRVPESWAPMLLWVAQQVQCSAMIVSGSLAWVRQNALPIQIPDELIRVSGHPSPGATPVIYEPVRLARALQSSLQSALSALQIPFDVDGIYTAESEMKLAEEKVWVCDQLNVVGGDRESGVIAKVARHLTLPLGEIRCSVRGKKGEIPLALREGWAPIYSALLSTGNRSKS